MPDNKNANRAALFDIDGTLVDSVDQHAQAWQDAFKQFGVKTDFQQVREQIGKGADKLLPFFLSRLDIDKQGKQIVERREEIFHRDYQDSIQPFPGVRQLFEQVMNDGIQIALASSSKAKDLMFYKQLLNIEDLLDAETASEDANQTKPAPDIFGVALQKLGINDAAKAIVVGDTPHDVEGAGNAGMRSIGLLCGGVPEQTLRTAGALQIFRDPQDLLARYRESLIAQLATA